MRKLGCQFDRGKITAASQGIARANRPKKFAIEVFRIVITETARRVCQDRQWMNQSLIERECVNKRFESGAGGARTPCSVDLPLDFGVEEIGGSNLRQHIHGSDIAQQGGAVL